MVVINYLGLKCEICGVDFKETDDVVVCPECGTPMHRACYKENGGCPNKEKHGDSFVFEGFEKIKESAQGKKSEKKSFSANKQEEKTNVKQQSDTELKCQFCGEINKKEANFCNRCGRKLVKITPIPQVSENDKQDFIQSINSIPDSEIPQMLINRIDPLSGVSAETEFEEGVTAADLACYVSVNTPYYIRVFNFLKKKANKFNVSAFVFSGVWYLYRKLYKIGFLIIALETLLYSLRYYISKTFSMDIMKKIFEDNGLSVEKAAHLTVEQWMKLSASMQQLPINEQVLMSIPSILLILQFCIMIYCGFAGNKSYYKHCINTIKEIKQYAKEEALDDKEISQTLYFSGGVNVFAAGALGILYLILFF